MTLGTYQVGDLVRLYDLSATLAPIVYRVTDRRFNAGRTEALIIDIEAEGPEAGDSLQWVDTIRLEKAKEGNTNGTRTQPTSAATDLGGGPGLRDSGRDLPGSGPAGGAVNAPVIPPDELVRMVAQVRHWQKGGDPRTRVPDTDEGFAEAVAKLINFRLEWILRDAKREHELDVAKVREEVARMTATIQERVESLDRRLSGTQSDIGVMGIRSDLGRLAMRLDMLEEGKGGVFADIRGRLGNVERLAVAPKTFLNDGNVVGPYVLDKGTDSQLRELDARIRNLAGRLEAQARDLAGRASQKDFAEGLAAVAHDFKVVNTRVDLLEDAVKGAGVAAAKERDRVDYLEALCKDLPPPRADWKADR